MELVSLIIMVLGVAALVGIYVLSRVSRRDLLQKRDVTVPVLRDGDDNERTSILEDNPARDGKKPAASARELSNVMMSGIAGKKTVSEQPRVEKPRPAPELPPQLVLFVAADIEQGFDGGEVLQALDNAGLCFGDMGIFHRMVLTPEGEKSLFTVANGVKPWTLTPEDLAGHSTPGLAMILNLPAPLDDNDAIHDFLRSAERIARDLNGVLKNREQEPLTSAQRADLLALAA